MSEETPDQPTRWVQPAIAWVSLAILTANLVPSLSLRERPIWGYIGVAGIAAALGINSRTIRRLRKEVVSDSLTGLVTRPFMENMLEREAARAARYREPLSLIFADIDHFKRINDKYGHRNGDIALQSVARTLRTWCRSCDTVVRYGGEEFVIVLPKTSREEAAKLADRLRAAVEYMALPIPDSANHRSPCVTISLGVATFPDDADSIQNLVDRADGRMFVAKRLGRNRVVVVDDDELNEASQSNALPPNDLAPDGTPLLGLIGR